MPKDNPLSCRHNEGFGQLVAKGNPTGVYVCYACEVFYLNFNPREFPDGVAMLGPFQEEKILLLASSKY